jgi:membrane protease YdiL (CAAX protease family)
MKKIAGFLANYLRQLDKRSFAVSVFFITAFIFINYHFGLSNNISKLPFVEKFLSWYAVFLTVFSFGYVIHATFSKASYFTNKRFWLLLIIAPAVFAWKMAYHVQLNLSPDAIQNAYWNNVVYYPFKLIVVAAILFSIWKILDQDQSNFYGVTIKNFDVQPYLLMLLIMLPLVALASTQHDFLAMYPKLNSISFLKAQNNGWYRLLYELSYGSDFFTIELFFRGFLILAFAKWAGKDAILPMALFYCTIHFGKPLGECISSFFGGLILGVVVYHTRSIFGGLIVHLGIAWMMELGGYLGNQHFH